MWRHIVLVFTLCLGLVPVQAEFHGISDFDTLYSVVADPGGGIDQYLLEGFTFSDHNIPFEQLVLGRTTGVAGFGTLISTVDDFDLHTMAARHNQNPSEMQTRYFGGLPVWKDTNGPDQYDFFVFEWNGNDDFTVQAILPGDVLGQAVSVSASTWHPVGEPAINLKAASTTPQANQTATGIAFKVTDLLDASGKSLPNDAVLEGIQLTSGGMDPSCICATKPPLPDFAINPNPAELTIITDTMPTLTWTAGFDMQTQDVYFSNDEEAVRGGDVTALAASQEEVSLTVSVSAGQHYYWRVDTINSAQQKTEGAVWSFEVGSKATSEPLPSDGRWLVDPNQDLSWKAAVGAVEYTVYIGVDRDAVASATEGGVVVSSPTHDPGTLAFETTYFWRVDAFDGINTYIGPVWRFVTARESGGLKAIYFLGNALEGDPMLERIDPQIEFDWGENGLEEEGITGAFSVRWTGEVEVPQSDTWIFHTASNDGVRLWVNGQQLVNAFGTNENGVERVKFRSGTIDLQAGTSYPMTIEFQWTDGSAELSLKWQDTEMEPAIVPSIALLPIVRATLVAPTQGAVDLPQALTLQWQPVEPEAQHDVYFGDAADAVAHADTDTTGLYRGRQDQTTYEVGGLALGKTYYWRIDEVLPNQDIIPGRLWYFTTGAFVVIDNFESYTDADGEEIWQTWMDGFAGNGTGSVVGYLVDQGAPPWAETGSANSGSQSMPFQFDNDGEFYDIDGNLVEAFLSEVSREVDITDWTHAGEIPLTTLGLSYFGPPLGSTQYDTNTGVYTIEGVGRDIWDTSDEFRYVYQATSGDTSLVAKVESLVNTGGTPHAGVMIRESLDPNAPFGMAGVTSDGRMLFRYRTQAADIVSQVWDGVMGLVFPVWLKIDRVGGTFSAYYSADGVVWQQRDEPVDIPMPSDVVVGLVALAHVDDRGKTTSETKISEVMLNGADVVLSESVNVALPQNTIEEFYVGIQDATGTQALVYSDDPQATRSPLWQEWRINLTRFEEADLSQVQSVFLGVGNKTNPQAGGEGILLIDDLRLYP